MSAGTAPPPADRLLDALGDPTRRAILRRTARRPATVSELAKSLDVTLSAVGQHIHVLEGCGLLQTQKVGRVRVCRFDTEGLTVLEEWIALHRSTWEQGLDRLGDYLAAEPDA